VKGQIMVDEEKHRKHKFLFGGIGFAILGIGFILGCLLYSESSLFHYFFGKSRLIDLFSDDIADIILYALPSTAPLAFIFGIIGIIKDKFYWLAWIVTIIAAILTFLVLWLIYFILYCFPDCA
jgi:hypothetical protein